MQINEEKNKKKRLLYWYAIDFLCKRLWNSDDYLAFQSQINHKISQSLRIDKSSKGREDYEYKTVSRLRTTYSTANSIFLLLKWHHFVVLEGISISTPPITAES